MANDPTKPGPAPGPVQFSKSTRKRRRRLHPSIRAALDALNRRELPKGIDAVVLQSGRVRWRASEPAGERGRRSWSPLYDTLDDALRHQSIYREERAKADPQRDALTLKQCVDLAIQQMRDKGRREGSISWFRECANVWLKYFGGDRAPATISPSDVKAFVAARRREVSASSLAHYRRSLLTLRKHGGPDLLRGVGDIWPMVEEVEMQFFPLARVREMVEQIRGSGHPLAEQDADVVGLLAATGWRRGELVRLRVGDIDLDARRAWIIGKRRREHVPLSTGAAETLARMISRTDGEAESSVLPGGEEAVRRAMNRARRVVKEPRLGAHALRHSFVAALVDAGHNIDQIRKLSRHRSLAALGRYLHSAKPDRDALEAVDPLAKRPSGRKSKVAHGLRVVS